MTHWNKHPVPLWSDVKHSSTDTKFSRRRQHRHTDPSGDTLTIPWAKYIFHASSVLYSQPNTSGFYKAGQEAQESQAAIELHTG